MQCAEFENLTQEILDRRLPWDQEPALAKHAQTCAVCRRLATSMQQAIVGLGLSSVPPVSLDLATRVVGAVSRAVDVCPAPLIQRAGAPAGSLNSPGSISIGIWPRAALWAAAAALLVMVAAPWNWFAGGPADAPADPAVAQRNVAPDLPPPDPGRLVDPNRESPRWRPPATDVASAPPMAPLPPISDLARSAGVQYQSFAQHTGESLAVAWLIVPPVPETTAGLANRAASVPPAAGATGVWLEGMTEGLKPVTQSTAGSLHSFMQLLPSAPLQPAAPPGENL